MTEQTSPSVTMSAAAAKRIGAILSTEPDKQALRVTVSGGGCSGFQYGFELATEATDDDLVLERDGVKIYIDSISSVYTTISSFFDLLILINLAMQLPILISRVF